MLNKLLASLLVCVAVFALALAGCKKAEVYNVDGITEDNALQEADKVLEEIDRL